MEGSCTAVVWVRRREEREQTGQSRVGEDAGGKSMGRVNI